MIWEVEELEKLSELQPELVEKALKDLWERNPDLFRVVVINAYIDEKISLGKAAELLSLTRIELEKEFQIKGIPIRRLSKEDIIAEAEAIKKW